MTSTFEKEWRVLFFSPEFLRKKQVNIKHDNLFSLKEGLFVVSDRFWFVLYLESVGSPGVDPNVG